MSHLFYYLIYREKTKRWLLMLEQFEENQTLAGKDLATKLSCTQRTIQSDIKQIKNFLTHRSCCWAEKMAIIFPFDLLRRIKEKTKRY